MALAGMPLRPGWPGAKGQVAVWGHAPRAARGQWVVQRSGAALLRIEDAFIRSIHPGRMGEPPIGLLIDRQGVHYDPARPSDLETLLARTPLDDHALLERARHAIARMKRLRLAKYNDHDPALPLPDPGYVLVIDQTRDDAAIRHGGLDGALGAHLFREMLVQAQLDHPGARILIKTHPETRAGLRPGYFGAADCTAPQITLLDAPLCPWGLLDGAIAVYTVSSHMGFEAIFAGHKPHVFGLPFYAGWGLTQDRIAHPRRKRELSRAQLFAGAMLQYPCWYDPCRDRLCDFEDVLDHMEALSRAWREDRAGYVALNMRLWKRPHLQRFFGRWKGVRFARNAPKQAGPRKLMVWGDAALREGTRATRIEDGFLRSRGLGAELTPPLSLIADDLGLYYDPQHPSRLEALLNAPLPPDARLRAQKLLERLRAGGVTKYNLGGAQPELPAGHRILVPGQVEDDASIRLGASGDVSTNLALLQKARAQNPDAVILYKSHPDVEAGLRPGAVARDTALGLADQVLERADPGWLLDHVDEVWTITSTLGFEALLRGLPVTTLGAPFYAGWGLTRDLAPVPARRQARPDLVALVHAALIAYPRYLDPVTRLPCSPELALERLQAGDLPHPPALRLLAKLQGAFASHARWWR